VSFRVPQDNIYPRCIDGRPPVAVVEWQAARWTVTRRGDAAEAEHGPQFLGASLLFVRALQVIAGMDLPQAFYLTEIASQQAGLGLQFHQDDQEGALDLATKRDEEIAALAQTYHTGCGFVAFAWGEDGDDVVREAKRRHWRVQILTGGRNETGAVINYQPGDTFDTAGADAAGAGQFNTDVAEARAVFARLENLTVSRGFADRAAAWMLDTYREVVVALEGVPSAGEIIELR
jgi:hypothetical protein